MTVFDSRGKGPIARSMEIRRLSLDEFIAELKKTQGTDMDNAALVCPRCKSAQSIRSLMLAGLSRDAAERNVHFNCVGRYTKDLGCDWSLGGLFKIHELLVDEQPSFRIATATEAQALKEQCDQMEAAR